MWDNSEPAPDARHACALAREILKVTNSFTQMHRKALEEADAGYREQANDERNRVKEARARIVELFPKFQEAEQTRLGKVLESVDKALKTHLPFSPPLEADPLYLENFMNRIQDRRANSEINVPIEEKPPVRMANSVIGIPLEEHRPRPLAPSVAGSLADDTTKDVFFDAEKSAPNDNLAFSLHSFPSIPVGRKTSTPRGSGSLGRTAPSRPSSVAAAKVAAAPLPTASANKDVKVPAKDTVDSLVKLQTLSLQEKWNQLAQKRNEFMEARDKLDSQRYDLDRKLKTCDDECKKLKTVTANINNDCFQDDDVIAISQFFDDEDDQSQSVRDWLKKTLFISHPHQILMRTKPRGHPHHHGGRNLSWRRRPLTRAS